MIEKIDFLAKNRKKWIFWQKLKKSKLCPKNQKNQFWGPKFERKLILWAKNRKKMDFLAKIEKTEIVPKDWKNEFFGPKFDNLAKNQNYLAWCVISGSLSSYLFRVRAKLTPEKRGGRKPPRPPPLGATSENRFTAPAPWAAAGK